MKRMVEKILGHWGVEITLQRADGDICLQGMLRHTGAKGQQSAQRQFSPLGEVPGGQYIYIGPVQPAVKVGDTLLLDEAAYELRRVEKIWFRSTPVYCWGLCVKKSGDGT